MHFLKRWGNSGAGQDELSQLLPMIHLETDRIPQLGGKLPFIQQARRLSLKQLLRGKVGQFKVLPDFCRIVHVKDTPGDLLGSRRFSAPFGAFDQHCAHAFQLSGKDSIRDTRSVLFHFGITLLCCFRLLL